MVQICAHISLLQLPLQFNQGSNLDKKSTMVIYKVCTIHKLICMNNNSQPKKILNFQTRYLRSKSLKTPENWTTREIESVTTNPPGLKPGQGVLPSGLQTLQYNLGDMHNLTPNIRGDITLQR
jgi:hypothetical protein